MSEPTHYHLRLDDETRTNIQLESFNFFHYTGKNMRIPPKLYEDLKNGGVDMKYIDADKALEN